MPKLDFTALDRVAYRGCETEEERAEKDALIEQGFYLLEGEDKDNPFLQASETASEPPTASDDGKPSSALKQASEGKREAFMSASGTRNYKTLYRVAHDYHKRHNPPTVDREYWRAHPENPNAAPQVELDYWDKAAKDASDTANAYNDQFLTGLLIAIYEELEREYNMMRDAARGTASGQERQA